MVDGTIGVRIVFDANEPLLGGTKILYEKFDIEYGIQV